MQRRAMITLTTLCGKTSPNKDNLTTLLLLRLLSLLLFIDIIILYLIIWPCVAHNAIFPQLVSDYRNKMEQHIQDILHCPETSLLVHGDARKRTNTSKRIIFPHPPSPVQVSCKMFKPVGSGERAPAHYNPLSCNCNYTHHFRGITSVQLWRGKTLRTSWGEGCDPRGATSHEWTYTA